MSTGAGRNIEEFQFRARAIVNDPRLSGVSDIFSVEDTARRNPQSVVDIIRGAFEEGMSDFTFNLDTNGFIRITGYLARKSDGEALANEGGRYGSTVFAAGSVRTLMSWTVR